MAKQATKANSKPATDAGNIVKGSRGKAFEPSHVIRIVDGSERYNARPNMACDYAMRAMVDSKGKPRTVEQFVTAFGAMCERPYRYDSDAGKKAGDGHIPGRAGQPGSVQARAILRLLHDKRHAVTVSAK